MSATIAPARGSTWRFIAVLLVGLAILVLVPYLLYRASVLPVRVLFQSHRDHTALSLPDGQVLIVGGNDGSGIERYDPKRERWHRLAGLDQRSYGVTATLLADGRVLVIGKRFSAPQFFRLYDPATESWSEAPTGPVDFYQHTATLLRDGTILFVGGGSNNGTSSAARYDPATNQWLPTASMVSSRTGHTATLLPDGRVLVVGGWISSGGTRAEIYDPKANTWLAAANLRHSHARFAATLLANGRVLISGGNEAGTTEIYNPAINTWDLTAPLETPRYGHTATLLADGTVLVTGGDPEGATPKGLASAERFDPLANRWSPVEEMARPRYGHTATLLPDGRVLVVDGNSSTLAGSTEHFDPRTGRWGMAGGITVQQLWWPLVLLPLYLVAFVLVCFVAILFDGTRWGSWLCINARLHNLALPIARQAKKSLLWLYGGSLCSCLALLLLAIPNTSLWPYPRSPFPLLFFMIALQVVCLGIFLATRKALAPPATLTSSPSAR